MNSLIYYLLQVIAASGLLYGYYHLILRNKKFHQYNRYYLLASVVISILVPFLDIPVYFSDAETDSSVLLKTLTIISSPEPGSMTNSSLNIITSQKSNWFTRTNLCYGFYILVAAFVLLRIIFSLLKIRSIARNNPVEKLDTIRFINTSEPGTPFSFFRWLFWNNKIELRSSKGEQIFRHELFHILHRHSLDIICMELLTVLFWINPFFHLVKKEIKAIHEFLADKFAMNENQKWEYAELLLMQALNTQTHLVNPFFHNQIKRRIAMLTLSNNPSYQYLRKILVLPVAAIVIILFAFSYETSKNRNNESDKNTLLNQEIILADTTKPTVATTPKFTPPVLKKIMPGQKLVVINGQIRGIATDLNKLHGWVDMNQVESMTILKDESGVLKYGEMAKYGVIEIKMKPKKDSIKVQEIVLPGYNQHDTSKPKIELIKNSVTGETEALYNGRKFTRILIFPPSDQLSFLYTSNELEMVSKQESDLIKKQYSSQIENYLDPIIDTIYYKDGSAEFVYKKGSREKITTQEAARLIRKIPATEEKRTDIIFDKAETPPSFPGGKEAWNAFVTKNIDPDIATKNGAEKGDYLIWVEFTVDENGNINDLKPLTKTKYGMEEELVRTMKLSPKWSPARQNGYPVKIWWGQSVTFRSTNPLNVTTTIDYSSIPPISRKELTNADVHNLLGLPRGTEVLSFTFTIDLPEDAVTEAPNYGDQFSEKTKTLMQNAIAGNLITLDRIRIKLEGNEKKIGAKAYMVVD